MSLSAMRWRHGWATLILFLIMLGIAKAGLHFVKLVILAGMGLAGMYYLHQLAQDYNKIRPFGGGGSGGGGGGGGNRVSGMPSRTKTYYPTYQIKRHDQGVVDGNSENEQNHLSKWDWNMIVKQDRSGCARSFVCQITATPRKDLTSAEINILKVLWDSRNRTEWGILQLIEAAKIGERVSNPSGCRKYFRRCPYTKNAMMSLLTR